MSNQVAQTILAQLGGNRFVAMTGAKNLMSDGNALRFHLPARFARNGANLVSVELDARDLYTVKFSKYRKLEVTEISVHDHVPADALALLFRDKTGLEVTL